MCGETTNTNLFLLQNVMTLIVPGMEYLKEREKPETPYEYNSRVFVSDGKQENILLLWCDESGEAGVWGMG